MRPVKPNRLSRLAATLDDALSRQRPAHERPISAIALLVAIGLTLPTPSAANTFVVNTTDDPGAGGTLSLRQAVTAANASAGNIVEFAPALVGSTITLSGSQIAIQKSMTITGPGKDSLTISGNNASRIFYVRPVPDDTDPTHTVVSISGVTLTNGNANPLTTGGAIRAVHSQLSVTNSTISGSKAWFGAGLSTSGGVLYVGHSRLVGNQASVSGGGVDSDSDTSVHLIGNAISGNTAGAQGAGVYVYGTADALIVASTISGNNVLQPDIGTPSQGGGGVMFQNITLNGSAYIVESTITQNYSPSGGAGVALAGTNTGNAAKMYFSTIVGNSAAPYETGIGITSGSGIAHVYNTIVANNASQSGADDLAGSFKTKQSLIESPGGATITGTGVVGVDPKLAPLADNGGETLTMLPMIGSPVIHAVACTACVTFSLVDQRGAPRHNPSDMGAVERQYPEDLIFRNGFSP